METKKLTKKQKIFVDTYLETGNGTLAAKKAYDIKENDELTPRVIASENLTKPNIIKAIEDVLSDDILGKKHSELLNSTRLEHMVFVTGPKNEAQREEVNKSRQLDAEQHGKIYKPWTAISDDEIIEMLEEINCKVRRIEHGETARHVYFWANDNKAIKDALDMAYKIKGTYAPEKRANLNVNLNVSPNEKIKKLAQKLNAK